MAIIFKTQSRQEQITERFREFKGVFFNDATPLISTTVSSGGALGARTVTVASITGFASNAAISIAGGGNAGGTVPLETFITATPAAGVLTFREKVLQTAGLTAGAVVQQMLKLPMPIAVRKLKLINLTDGVEWQWYDGMDRSSVIKTVWATNTTTLELFGGPLVMSDGAWLPQSLMGINKNFAFEAEA
jgi:hypothetical protein